MLVLNSRRLASTWYGLAVVSRIFAYMQVFQRSNLPRKLQQVTTFIEEDEEVERIDKPTAPQYEVCVEGDSQFFGFENELIEGFPDGIWVYANGRC